MPRSTSVSGPSHQILMLAGTCTRSSIHHITLMQSTASLYCQNSHRPCRLPRPNAPLHQCVGSFSPNPDARRYVHSLLNTPYYSDAIHCLIILPKLTPPLPSSTPQCPAPPVCRVLLTKS